MSFTRVTLTFEGTINLADLSEFDGGRLLEEDPFRFRAKARGSGAIWAF